MFHFVAGSILITARCKIKQGEYCHRIGFIAEDVMRYAANLLPNGFGGKKTDFVTYISTACQ
jgi:hypothetical protein